MTVIGKLENLPCALSPILDRSHMPKLGGGRAVSARKPRAEAGDGKRGAGRSRHSGFEGGDRRASCQGKGNAEIRLGDGMVHMTISVGPALAIKGRVALGSARCNCRISLARSFQPPDSGRPGSPQNSAIQGHSERKNAPHFLAASHASVMREALIPDGSSSRRVRLPTTACRRYAGRLVRKMAKDRSSLRANPARQGRPA